MAFLNSSTAEPEPPWKTKKTGFLSLVPSFWATNSWCLPRSSGWSLTLLRGSALRSCECAGGVMLTQACRHRPGKWRRYPRAECRGSCCLMRR
ncbi:hypothetical protein CH063_10180 [Colletotrichum higginsianum]|uniref:Uncharacterized protein n=1 Tax=Colletotrichum higginsianum (strain IMI 349063) TaxID=759273 RepID=H1VGG2_COLHI|nr:hypothetical protein CH063_10180 [Colletotrichum higginsianum]